MYSVRETTLSPTAADREVTSNQLHKNEMLVTSVLNVYVATRGSRMFSVS